MNFKIFLYIVLDLVIFVGAVISIFNYKDIQVSFIFIAALIGSLIHQVYTEKNYFKGMFDQGGPFLVKYRYLFIRWALTILAVAFAGAFVVDYMDTL